MFESIPAPCEERIVSKHPRAQLVIGVPVEKSTDETRLPLTPQGVERLVSMGHSVRIMQGAGLRARFSDEVYVSAGAQITHEEEVWKSDVVVKILPPTADEVCLLSSGQTLVCLVSRSQIDKNLFLELSCRKITLLAPDIMLDASGEPVLSRRLGELEGLLAVSCAAHLLQSASCGKGIILGGITGIPQSEVLILGADPTAVAIAHTAVSMGAVVKVFDEDYDSLCRLVSCVSSPISTSLLHPQALEKALRSADVVVGTRACCHAHHSFALSSDHIQLLKSGAVFIDLNIVNGGRSHLSHPTSLSEPTFVASGVVHHCLPDITVLASHTATIVLSDVLTPLLMSIGEGGGVENTLRSDQSLRSSVAIYNGTTTSAYLAKRTGAELFDIRLLII